MYHPRFIDSITYSLVLLLLTKCISKYYIITIYGLLFPPCKDITR